MDGGHEIVKTWVQTMWGRNHIIQMMVRLE